MANFPAVALKAFSTVSQRPDGIELAVEAQMLDCRAGAKLSR